MGNTNQGFILRADGKRVCGSAVDKLKLQAYDPNAADSVYYGEDKHGKKLMSKFHGVGIHKLDGNSDQILAAKLWLEHGERGLDLGWSKVSTNLTEFASIKNAVKAKLGLKSGNDTEKFIDEDDEPFVNKIAAYRGMFERSSKRRGGYESDYDGGCGCAGYVGSYDHRATALTRSYSGSAASDAKQQLTTAIVSALNNIGIKADGSTPEEQIKSQIAKLPTADRFKNNDSAHAATCVGIAKAINAALGGENRISTTLPPDVILQQIAEYLKSLSHSVKGEYAEVIADIKSITDNLHVLQVISGDLMNELSDKGDYVGELDKAHIGRMKEINKLIVDETSRQLSMLRNLLDITLDPTSRKLADLAQHNKELDDAINGNILPGTTKFSKNLARVLESLGGTAYEAVLVDAALKKVGMTIDDYAKTSTIESLKSKVVDAGLKAKGEDISKYIKAVELLSSTLDRSHNIAEIIKNKKGSHEDNIDAPIPEGFKEGGAGEKYPPSKIEREVTSRKKLRDIIFSAFFKQVNDAFDKFILTLNMISGKIGKEIPLSEQLDGFRSILQKVNLQVTRKNDIYYALVGYFNDALSKSKKDMFVMDIKLIFNFIDSIIEDSTYASSKQYFIDLKSTLVVVLGIIDKYSDEIHQKFGSDEVKHGSGEYNGEFKPEALKWKTKKTLADALREFDYRYRVVQIKENLKHSSTELAMYGEKYEQMTAKAIAEYVQSTDEDWWNDKAIAKRRKELKDAKDANALKKFEEECKFMESQHKSRKQFWATVEAVDMYMRYFTNGIVSNPDDIKDIKAMLDDVEVISDWYDEETGNKLAKLFDYCSTGNSASAPQATSVDTKPHYYANLPIGVNEHIGNPVHHIWNNDGSTKLCDIKASVTKMFGGLTALKNLLSVFVHLGAKFGGEDISKKVFMTPAQIYANLIDFIAASSFATRGFEEKTTPVVNRPRSSPSSDQPPPDDERPSLDDRELLKSPTDIPKSTRLSVKDFKEMCDIFIKKIPEFIENKGSPVRPDLRAIYNLGRKPIRALYQNDEIYLGAAYEWYNKKFFETIESIFGKDNAEWAQRELDRCDHFTASRTGGSNNKQYISEQKVFWTSGGNNKKSNVLDWSEENKHFHMIIKAICAKIFTVVGTYDIFDRPHEYNGFNPIRMILGGAGDYPKVDEAAVPLYLRLPLLCQFYRDLFSENKTTPNGYGGNNSYTALPINENTAVRISMIPDLDGTFSGLIRLIFRKTKDVEGTHYSDSEMIEIIRECNLIYQKSLPKHPKNTIMEIINELVAEVNRRYGIVTQAMQKTYEEEFGYNYRYRDAKYDEDDLEGNQYALLPGEGEEEAVRPAPSQRLLQSAMSTKSSFDSPYKITSEYAKLISDFRCKLDDEFRNSEKEQDAYSFNPNIKMTQIKLSQETDDEARFRLICSLVRADGVYSRTDAHKYLMFHETVVSGLNILSAVHTLLTRFQRRVMCLDVDLLVVCYNRAIKTKRDSGVSIDTLRATAKNYQKIYRAIFAEFCKICKCPPDDNMAYGVIISCVLGYNKYYKGVGGAETIDSDTASSNIIEIATKDITKDTINTCLNKQYMMQELLETIWGLSNDLQGLVEVRVNDQNIYLTYDKLKGEIECMFDCVSKSIELLRPHVSKEIIGRYTDKYMPGSLYWLKEQLMEKIIDGRPKGLTDEQRAYYNLDDQMRKLSATFKLLADKNESYSQVFAKMVFYDALIPNSGIACTDATEIEDRDNVAICTQKPELINFKDNSYEMLHAQGNANLKMIDLDTITRFKQLYSFDDVLNMNRSCLFVFNQLIAKFIYAFYDTASQKMYTGLIASFANGTFSHAVSDLKYTFPDVGTLDKPKVKKGEVKGIIKLDDALSMSGGATPNVEFKKRKDPDADHVLFSSLSIILRTMTTTRNVTTQNYVNLFENVADIPEYLKEKMRANLPAFRNLFDELRIRCEQIKVMLNNNHVNVARDKGVFDTAVDKGDLKLKDTIEYKFTNAITNVDVKAKFTAILDTIIRGCSTLRAACDATMKEIGVDIKFFELYKGSIKEYKGLYNVDPFMPLSSTLYILRNNNAKNDNDFLPVHALGETKFKFMYGTTDILQEMKKNHTLENNLGFKNCVDTFNSLSGSKFQFSKNDAEAFLNCFTKLSRWIYNVKHIKGMLTPHVTTPYFLNANSHIMAAAADDEERGENVFKNNHYIYISGMFTRDDLIITEKIHGNDTRLRNVNETSTSLYNPGLVTLTNESEISIVYEGGNKAAKARRETIKHGADKHVPAYFGNLTPVFSSVNTQDTIIQFIENSQRNDSLDKLIMFMLGKDKKKGSRMTIQNIIDLNIVPISVHALMREIPLANLYNYTYTFDRLITELYYGKNCKELEELCKTGTPHINNSLDLLVESLKEPHIDFNNHLPYVINMLLGVPLAGELGRPKFLSDQIFGKVIFGDLFAPHGEIKPEYEDRSKQLGPAYQGTIRKSDAPKVFTEMIKNVITVCAEKKRIMTDVDSCVGGTFDAISRKLATVILDNPHISIKELATAIEGTVKAEDDVDLSRFQEKQAAAVAKLASTVLLVLNGMAPVGDEDETAVAMGLFSIDFSKSDATWGKIITDDDFIKCKLGAYIVNNKHEFDEKIINTLSHDATSSPDGDGITLNLIFKPWWRAQRAKNTKQQPISGSILHYKDEASKLQSRDLGTKAPAYTDAGNARLDTHLIKNIIFIINAYRSVRLKLQRDLNYTKEIIRSSASVTANELTEFRGYEKIKQLAGRIDEDSYNPQKHR